MHHALGHPERVVVADRGHAGAQLDPPGALGGGGDEDLRGGDDLAARRVVLPDPGLVVVQPVQVGDQLEVALDGRGGVLPRRVERCQEDAEPEPAHGRLRDEVGGGLITARAARRVNGCSTLPCGATARPGTPRAPDRVGRGLSRCSPEGIRTLATAVRGRRPGPLDDGASAVRADVYSRRWCFLAGVPGLEPRLTEPETVGLPITPYPMGVRRLAAPRRRYPTGSAGSRTPPGHRVGSDRARRSAAAARAPGCSREGLRRRPVRSSGPEPAPATGRPAPRRRPSPGSARPAGTAARPRRAPRGGDPVAERAGEHEDEHVVDRVQHDRRLQPAGQPDDRGGGQAEDEAVEEGQHVRRSVRRRRRPRAVSDRGHDRPGPLGAGSSRRPPGSGSRGRRYSSAADCSGVVSSDDEQQPAVARHRAGDRRPVGDERDARAPTRRCPTPRVTSASQRVAARSSRQRSRPSTDDDQPEPHAVRDGPGSPHDGDGHDQREVGEQQHAGVGEVQQRRIDRHRRPVSSTADHDDHRRATRVDARRTAAAPAAAATRPSPRAASPAGTAAGRRAAACPAAASQRTRRGGGPTARAARRRAATPAAGPRRRAAAAAPTAAGRAAGPAGRRLPDRAGGRPAGPRRDGPAPRRAVTAVADAPAAPRPRREPGAGCARGRAAPSTRTAAGRPCGR